MGMTIRRLATAAKVGGATDLQPKAYPNTVAFVVPSPGRTLTSDREGQPLDADGIDALRGDAAVTDRDRRESFSHD